MIDRDKFCARLADEIDIGEVFFGPDEDVVHATYHGDGRISVLLADRTRWSLNVTSDGVEP